MRLSKLALLSLAPVAYSASVIKSTITVTSTTCLLSTSYTTTSTFATTDASGNSVLTTETGIVVEQPTTLSDGSVSEFSTFSDLYPSTSYTTTSIFTTTDASGNSVLTTETGVVIEYPTTLSDGSVSEISTFSELYPSTSYTTTSTFTTTDASGNSVLTTETGVVVEQPTTLSDGSVSEISTFSNLYPSSSDLLFSTSYTTTSTFTTTDASGNPVTSTETGVVVEYPTTLSGGSVSEFSTFSDLYPSTSYTTTSIFTTTDASGNPVTSTETGVVIEYPTTLSDGSVSEISTFSDLYPSTSYTTTSTFTTTDAAGDPITTTETGVVIEYPTTLSGGSISEFSTFSDLYPSTSYTTTSTFTTTDAAGNTVVTTETGVIIEYPTTLSGGSVSEFSTFSDLYPSTSYTTTSTFTTTDAAGNPVTSTETGVVIEYPTTLSDGSVSEISTFSDLYPSTSYTTTSIFTTTDAAGNTVVTTETGVVIEYPTTLSGGSVSEFSTFSDLYPSTSYTTTSTFTTTDAAGNTVVTTETGVVIEHPTTLSGGSVSEFSTFSDLYPSTSYTTTSTFTTTDAAGNTVVTTETGVVIEHPTTLGDGSVSEFSTFSDLYPSTSYTTTSTFTTTDAAGNTVVTTETGVVIEHPTTLGDGSVSEFSTFSDLYPSTSYTTTSIFTTTDAAGNSVLTTETGVVVEYPTTLADGSVSEFSTFSDLYPSVATSTIVYTKSDGEVVTEYTTYCPETSTGPKTVTSAIVYTTNGKVVTSYTTFCPETTSSSGPKTVTSAIVYTTNGKVVTSYTTYCPETVTPAGPKTVTSAIVYTTNGKVVTSYTTYCPETPVATTSTGSIPVTKTVHNTQPNGSVVTELTTFFTETVYITSVTPGTKPPPAPSTYSTSYSSKQPSASTPAVPSIAEGGAGKLGLGSGVFAVVLALLL